MRVLVACEFSGIVREAFRKKGHDAWSCDLLPSEKPGQHIIGDVSDILNDGWDLMIAHPPARSYQTAERDGSMVARAMSQILSDGRPCKRLPNSLMS